MKFQRLYSKINLEFMLCARPYALRGDMNGRFASRARDAERQKNVPTQSIGTRKVLAREIII